MAVKTVSQTGQRRAISGSTSVVSGVSGDTGVHPGSDGCGLVLVTAEPVGGPSMPATAARCRSRSSIAAATVASPKPVAQSAMPTLVVRIVLDFRYRWLITWKRADAPSLGSGR